MQSLAVIESEFKERRVVLRHLQDMDHTDVEKFNDTFKKHETYLLSRQEALRNYDTTQLSSVTYRVSTLSEDIENQLTALSRCRNERLYKVDYHLTGVPSYFSHFTLKLNCHSPQGQHFHHPLQDSDPALVASLLSAAIPHLYGVTPRKSANAHLRGNKLIMALTSQTNDGERIGQHPVDIRTVQKYLQLDPTLHMYASCPRCSFIYPPKWVLNNTRPNSDKSAPSFLKRYPSFCTHNPFPNDTNWKPCQTALLRESNPSQDDIPLRPFMFQDAKDFLGRLLARRDIESIMDQAWSADIETEYLTDIFKTEMCQSFKGPDGVTFRSAANETTEGRYLFSLFIDWFNPYTNKAAGPVASVGVICMICLNLPNNIRYKRENIYLAGLIPGPKEPSMEEADHFLQPLIKCFEELWDPGIYFERTALYPTGKKVNAAIVPLIGDMKAIRKASGNAQCQVCHLPYEMVKKGVLSQNFPPPLTDDQYRDIAEEWMGAPDRKTRDKIYRENGIRWTPFLQLPYWRPSCFAIVDVMHALFLGIIATHFRHIYGMDGIQADVMEKTSNITTSKQTKINVIDEDNVRLGEQLMSSSSISLQALLKLRYSTLKNLCSVYLSSTVSPEDMSKKTMAKLLAEYVCD